jgi:hypothetical protein
LFINGDARRLFRLGQNIAPLIANKFYEGLFMRVCLAFFGLNRSLPWTHRSIIKNLITPLRAAGADVEVFGHFNIPSEINNGRSGENVKVFQNLGVDLLPFDELILEPQIDSNCAELLSRFERHDLQSNDSSNRSHLNLINQYHSLSSVMKMIECANSDTTNS